VKRAQELAAKMGFRQDPQFAPLINLFPGTSTELTVPQKPAKAPVLRLDAQGREIDEHGNVINMINPTSLSTLKVCSLSLHKLIIRCYPWFIMVTGFSFHRLI
jgi:U4/U6 small nuclear ribonucleoprotein PRP3